MAGIEVARSVAEMLDGCRGSRDLFDRARDAAADAESVLRRIRRLESMEGVRGAGLESRTSGPARPGLPATDARIDFEESKRRQLEADDGLVDLAFRILYGDGMTDGAASLTSEAHAQAVEYHWLQRRSWPDTAKLVGYSARQCQRMSGELFDACDAHGLAATIAGIGFASD